jgi:hypothetical protein
MLLAINGDGASQWSSRRGGHRRCVQKPASLKDIADREPSLRLALLIVFQDLVTQRCHAVSS